MASIAAMSAPDRGRAMANSFPFLKATTLGRRARNAAVGWTNRAPLHQAVA
jgi:hypothetical protein